LRKFREFVTDNFKNKTKHRHHEESL
jgi:hypothetical protein